MAEFLSARFGGSLGGCADGVPAIKGKRGGKINNADQQGETSAMATLHGANGASVNRDIGAKNVNLRTGEDALDMKSKTSMSEVERLEAAMKDMLASFKHKVEHRDGDTEVVSLEVDPSKEHPLDDTDKAQYDPRFTEASSPSCSRKQRAHALAPRSD
jgi:hypothetical protein